MADRASENWRIVASQLEDRKSAVRRRAAKRLRELRCVDAGPALLTALLKEWRDPRSWETQYQMIMAIGESGYSLAGPFLREIASREIENSILFMALGDSLVRLSDSVSSQVELVREFLERQNLLLIGGGLRAIAMTGVQVSETACIELMKAVESLPRCEMGLECRVWMAVVATGKSSPEIASVIQKWSSSDHQQLRRAASAALVGKRLKWRPL